MKIFKIENSPFQPPFANAYDLIFKMHAPYSDKSVTLLINTNVIDYKEKNDNPNIQVRQLTVTDDSNSTKLFLDYDNRVKEITIDDKTYRIELLRIEKSKDGFLSFEFSISEE